LTNLKGTMPAITQKKVIPEMIITALLTDEMFSKINNKFSILIKYNYIV